MTPLPEPTALAYTLIILTLTKLTRLGDPKCLYGEKLSLLGG